MTPYNSLLTTALGKKTNSPISIELPLRNNKKFLLFNNTQLCKLSYTNSHYAIPLEDNHES